jgi:hypothetical protein
MGLPTRAPRRALLVQALMCGLGIHVHGSETGAANQIQIRAANAFSNRRCPVL